MINVNCKFTRRLKIADDRVVNLLEKIIPVLEESYYFFADLLEQFPKVDYKTVASAVARLYEEGKIRQDKDGKFELKEKAAE